MRERNEARRGRNIFPPEACRPPVIRLAPRIPLVLLTVLVPALLLAPGARAHDANETVMEVELSPWIHEWDLREAGLLAVVAAVAALAVIYPLVGGTMPGTVGATDLKMEKLELEEHEAYLAELARVQAKGLHGHPPSASPPADAAMIHYVVAKRRAYGRSVALHFLLAGLIFVVTGVAGALLFAQDILQAALIGAGGPALIGQIVAKKEANKKIQIKNRAIADDNQPEEPRLRFAKRL